MQPQPKLKLPSESEPVPDQVIASEPPPGPETGNTESNIGHPFEETQDIGISEKATSIDLVKANKRLKAASITAFTLIALILVAVVGSFIYLNNYAITFTVNLKERFDGHKTWNDELDNVRIGDVIEYQLEFINDRGILSTALIKLGEKVGLSMTADTVIVKFDLSNNLEYVEGSMVLYDSTVPDGFSFDTDEIITTGMDLGRYQIKANGYIRIKCKVINDDLVIGDNTLVTWATVIVADTVEKDSATLFLKY